MRTDKVKNLVQGTPDSAGTMPFQITWYDWLNAAPAQNGDAGGSGNGASSGGGGSGSSTGVIIAVIVVVVVALAVVVFVLRRRVTATERE